MIRIVATLFTAMVSMLAAVGAIRMFQMPGADTTISWAFLGCAALLAVICVVLVSQGMGVRAPARPGDSLGARLPTSGRRPAAKPTAHKKPANAQHGNRPRPARHEPDVFRTKTQDSESLFDAMPDDTEPQFDES